MSDYTPPAVVTPTPGGAAGDGTIDGVLTANGLVVLDSVILDTVPQTSLGGSPTNTGYGTGALASNTTGIQNTASGQGALQSNTTGSYNTASGQGALQSNTTGSYNTASGMNALHANTTGSYNTASGQAALQGNTTGTQNTASGMNALYGNTTGSYNTASGQGALQQYNNTTGANGYFVALGYRAGFNYTGAELNNIILGSNTGTLGESNMLRIGNANSGVAGQGQIAFSQIGLVGLGLAPIYGLDNRRGVTAADSSAKTLYTTTASGQLYRLSGRILATAGTSPSATYTLKWTEGGTVQTETLTLSALNTIEAVSVLIQPDSGTAITAQLTAISGTSTTVNVAATVEEMA